jgi:hypothetical protein
MKREHPSLWLVRSRCAAFGAALAVTLGYGGLNYASAVTSTPVGNVFVPIVPCRLFDTRPSPSTVGTRALPITADEEFMAQVTGTNGDCSLPATSTAVVLNVTAVGPVGDGFLTVWPADAARPNTSNLNFSDGQEPVANAVTVKVGGGAIRLVSSASRVDVIADVVGYFEDHNHDDAYKPLGSVLGTTVVNTTTATTARPTTTAAATTTTHATTTMAATTTTRAATTTTVPATTTTALPTTTTASTSPASTSTSTTSTTVSTGIDVPASGTAVENGNALRAFLTGVVAPRIVRVAAGSFDIGDTPLRVPAGVTLRGGGASSTSITGQSPLPVHLPIVLLENNAAISDLTVLGLSGGAGIQADGNATVLRVNITVGQVFETNGAFYNAGSGIVTLDYATSRSYYGVNNGSYNGAQTGEIRITNSDIDGVVQNAGGGKITVQNSKIGQGTSHPESGVTAYFNGLIQLTNVQVYSPSVGLYPVDSGSRIEVAGGRIFSNYPRQALQTGTAICTAVLNLAGTANLSASCN